MLNLNSYWCYDNASKVLQRLVRFTMRWCWVLLMLLVAVRCDVSTTQQTSTFVVQQPFDYIATSLHYGGLLSNVMVLPQRIARALGRIRESTRNYRLMDDLWFEKLPGNINAGEKQSAALKSSPSNIVELADAVFDTHRLSWHNIVVQGNNLNVYKDRNQQYRLGITWQNDNSNSKSGMYLYKWYLIYYIENYVSW